MGATDGCECCDLFRGRFEREYATDTCGAAKMQMGWEGKEIGLGCEYQGS